MLTVRSSWRSWERECLAHIWEEPAKVCGIIIVDDRAAAKYSSAECHGAPLALLALAAAIYRMSPIGPPHMAVVNRLNRLLLPAAGDDAIVSVQNSVRLSDDTEVQPDIAVLCPHPGDYEETLPCAQDVLLIIEVADTSLDYDRTVKLPLYAQAAIVEVWIIDVRQQAVEQYTRPAEGQYTQVQTYRSGSILRAETLPRIEIAVDRLFPPRP